jgi:hypothetical protein
VTLSNVEDVWSRLCGGSGAPGWTLELAGFDIEALHQGHAASIHSENLAPGDPPPSTWPTGYHKLASATMFTLFWAGDELAPLLQIPISHHASYQEAFPGLHSEATVGISTFLQASFFAALNQLASHLESCTALIGFEPMNEPHRGYLELHSFYTWDEMVDLHYFHSPTALQSMALGAGLPQPIPVYRKSWPQPTALSYWQEAKPERPVWKDGCIWRKQGVWDVNEKTREPIVLKSTYFERHPGTGKPIDFYRDFWFPFVCQFAKKVTASNEYRRKHWFTFAGAIPNEVRFDLISSFGVSRNRLRTATSRVASQ